MWSRRVFPLRPSGVLLALVAHLCPRPVFRYQVCVSWYCCEDRPDGLVCLWTRLIPVISSWAQTSTFTPPEVKGISDRRGSEHGTLSQGTGSFGSHDRVQADEDLDQRGGQRVHLSLLYHMDFISAAMLTENTPQLRLDRGQTEPWEGLEQAGMTRKRALMSPLFKEVSSSGLDVLPPPLLCATSSPLLSFPLQRQPSPDKI